MNQIKNKLLPKHDKVLLTVCSAILLVMLISGCADRDFNDLKVEVGREKRKPVPPPKSLPPYAADIPYLYTPVNLRSPFQSITEKNKRQGNQNDTQKTQVKEQCTRPDSHRLQEALEEFPLDSLKMVGILEQGYKRWGLVLDPEKVVYQIEVNNYMGQNHGKVISVTESEIELVELVDDGRGCYVERSAILAAEKQN